jgi:L-seryl-tRNA(Ser) seleniumtransferase/D-glucosaminate-6-phosphate ammonia-lyase
MDGRDYYRIKFGLREVINASGRMTTIGGSIMPPEVLKELVDSAPYYIRISELQDKASEVIARLTGAEAGYVTSGAAAGIVIATAACIAGCDREKGLRLPDTDGMANEVIIQAAHNIGWARLLRHAGAKVVVVGNTEKTDREDIQRAISEKTASIHFIVSHWIYAQPSLVPLEDVVKIAHERNIPVTVDAAAEYDLRKYVAAGADLVIYSGGKEIEGPNDTGFICGKASLIKACRVQGELIGRPMKVSKEEICALLAALERHARKDFKAYLKHQREVLTSIKRQIDNLPYVKTKITGDETGRPIKRLEVAVENGLGKTVDDVIKELESGDPIVEVRSEYRASGKFHIDPRPLLPGQERVLAERLRHVLTRKD